ncbi:hypothetical protein IGM_02158 [Bacillus cereus HuB4-4]|uniref:Uncharacterized protein n=1 Tax=Bacillus cereus HuB4-4 TaxID=1053211 RepID=A0A9W5QW63_BACCE|nr:hypothetical protein IGM_02158 [Bacillus cereus HuB4-4]
MNFLNKYNYFFIMFIPMYIVILYFRVNKRKLGIREKVSV